MSHLFNDFLVIREQIYDHFQSSSACDDFFICDEANQDRYAAYYTAMYLLQDTTEALIQHRAGGFSSNSLHSYIEFWGVIQALVIHQDALKELYFVVHDERYVPPASTVWDEIRSLRNQCAGHPARQGLKQEPPKRVFMGREFGTYNGITFEKWDSESKHVSHVTFDLGKLIDRYAFAAKDLLEDIYQEMKGRWP